MRIPRTNFPPASFNDGSESGVDGEEHQPREGAALRRMRQIAEAAAKAEQPMWERHFFLAPNVRFTRTPDRDLHPDDVQQTVELRSEIAEKAPSVAELQEMISTMMILNGGSAAPNTLIEQAPEQPVNDNAVPVVESVKAAEVSIASKPLSPFAQLSDFAFWESFDVVVDEMPAPIAQPARVPVAPRRESTRSKTVEASSSVLGLYRSIEVKQAAVPVSVASAASDAPSLIPNAAPIPLAPTPTIKPAAFPWSRGARPLETAKPAGRAAVPTAIQPQASSPPAIVEPVQVASAVQVSKPFKIEPIAHVTANAGGYEFPPRALLQDPPETIGFVMSQEQLERNAGLLESVLEDFGIRGEIIHVRPGPVVTLYEFEPAPGVKSSRVIGLADDIARSMSALSARVAVVPGRNVIGVELPNATRETVYFGELIDSPDFSKTGYKLPLCLGKTIGGEPVIAELAKMPHLLVAGTTGSGKSVAINTMILSLLYRLTPEECRLIMVDPKMLELSVYDGIPHLLTPVVTDPKKAVLALKWAVREMEDRYRKMSRLGVRNIDGYNARAAEARARGETITHVVQTGFEKGTGEPIHENQPLDLAPMPYIVVIVDEMADLMMVAGKEIEGAIQRLAQMARAAGIHLIMATQRPSVDVITGTIKANFPTRISFQVTSKIDSRTILGEQGAEQLLGQGDMLHMAGGGRIARVHGPFVSDLEVEKVVAHLKLQGRPEYLDTVTTDDEAEEDEEQDSAVFDKSDMAAEDGNDLYDKAVKVILRDKKCSTSYIQRRLGIGYNKAASLVERMEKDGLVGPANHVGKREIIGNSHGSDHGSSSGT
ncbi:DNA translocase FtsK [Rhizobium sp. TH2]|uniref:DNA translocase FtsK n=1 Tax=Rhizobium sp. TH2 TaxID=2775403 RepID=UPI002157C261|nr:DNA translocase FtsK [Rhizobium sp. TH2]UVC07591.1 DNA translocase FtsK [Rhizobium sp. TH2]